MGNDVLPVDAVVGGDFTVVRRLDEGGMGQVYLVDQKSTGKPRALKVMRHEIGADPQLQKRFEQEARVGAHIPSEHVVDVIAAGIDQGTDLPYLVMELLEGEDLRHRIDRRGALSARDIHAVFEQLCHAMAAAHRAGVVHRDLKPENIFLTRSRRAGGGAFTVKVLDFGIAKLAAETGTRSTRTAVGSPMWMAPEQTAPGPVTPAADVWSLGLLAFELFTGRSFWRAANNAGGTTAQLLREIVLDPLPSAMARAAELDVASRLPIGFDEWFIRCVAREPSDRFADADFAWTAMVRMFARAEGLADTCADPGGRPPPLNAADTGAATAFLELAPNAGEPLVRHSAGPHAGLAHDTPVASVREAPAPSVGRPRGRFALVASALIGAGGLGAGWVISHRANSVAPLAIQTHATAELSAAPTIREIPASTSTTSALSVEPLPSTLGAASSPPLAEVATAAKKPSTATARSVVADGPPALAEVASTAPPAASSSLPGGFGDPLGPDGPPKATQWKVEDHHVRLFTRLVSNGSNVADRVVHRAIEWGSWQYLLCYERIFKGAKDLSEGTVTIGFDILNQLPRHGQIASSTFSSKSFNDCVMGTLLAQTINAAGPDGAGHVVMSFRFVPMN